MPTSRERWAEGTEVATVKLWDHIEAHPGCTIDELTEMAAADASIAVGARRAYANRLIRTTARAGHPARAVVLPGDVDGRRAVRYIVDYRLRAMCRYGSVRRDEAGGYFTARPIRRRGIGAMVQPADDVRADMAARNLHITVGRYLDQIESPTITYFPQPLRKALTNWYRAVRSEYLDGQQGA